MYAGRLNTFRRMTLLNAEPQRKYIPETSHIERVGTPDALMLIVCCVLDVVSRASFAAVPCVYYANSN